jgi:hypothetical protein
VRLKKFCCRFYAGWTNERSHRSRTLCEAIAPLLEKTSPGAAMFAAMWILDHVVQGCCAKHREEMADDLRRALEAVIDGSGFVRSDPH